MQSKGVFRVRADFTARDDGHLTSGEGSSHTVAVCKRPSAVESLYTCVLHVCVAGSGERIAGRTNPYKCNNSIGSQLYPRVWIVAPSLLSTACTYTEAKTVGTASIQ